MYSEHCSDILINVKKTIKVHLLFGSGANDFLPLENGPKSLKAFNGSL